MPKWLLPSLGFIGCAIGGQVAANHSYYVLVTACAIGALGTLVALSVRYDPK